MASAVSWRSRRRQPSPPPRLIPALVYVARLGSRMNLGRWACCRRYCLAVASADPETGFSFTYELQPDDLEDLFAAEQKRRLQRARTMFATVLWALFGAVFTAITVALNLRSVVRSSSGAPGWMYVVDAVIWGLVAYWGYISWRLSPKRLARRSWRSNVQLHGRHHDQVGPNGMTYTASDGTQVLIPWTAIDDVRETKRSFLLIDHRGEVRNSLPKRGLSSPDLIPGLREFLNRFIHGQPPATPDSAR